MTPMSRINRISAWVLLAFMLVYIISGFDIQGRFLSPQLSSLLHLKYLFLPAEAAFAFHAAYSIHLALRRRKAPKWAKATLLGAFIALNLSFVIYYSYLQFFRA